MRRKTLRILVIMIIMISAVLIAMNSFGQESYNKWSVSADYGIHMVADKSASNTNDFGALNGEIRYNVNPKFGIGLTGGVDWVELADFKYNPVDLTYSRINFEGYINAFNMVDVYSNRFTVLFHGGPGMSFIKTNNYYSETVPNVRGGLTFLVKVLPRIYLKSDLSVTANYATDKTLDGSYLISNTGVNSMVSTASVGLAVSLGKNKKHIDDYVPEPITPIVTTTIIGGDTTYVAKFYEDILYNQYIYLDTVQYVFFDNDESIIKETSLNSIFKTYINLKDNPTYTLTIIGWASDTDDKNLNVNSDIYNLKLSKKRAVTLKDKFINMGIDENRIEIDYEGKDKTFPKENVHDVGRRVELIVHTQ